MPASIKQYKATVAAGTNPQTTSSNAVSPANPRRTSLALQNTGANPAVVQFNNPVKGDGSDILLAVGAFIKWDQTLQDGSFNGPVGAIYIGATLATTVAILEGTMGREQ